MKGSQVNTELGVRNRCTASLSGRAGPGCACPATAPKPLLQLVTVLPLRPPVPLQRRLFRGRRRLLPGPHRRRLRQGTAAAGGQRGEQRAGARQALSDGGCQCLGGRRLLLQPAASRRCGCRPGRGWGSRTLGFWAGQTQIDGSLCQTPTHSINQPFEQSINHSINHSFIHSINHSAASDPFLPPFLLSLQLLRDVEGAQFVEAIEDALAARMRLMGGAARAGAARTRGGGGWCTAGQCLRKAVAPCAGSLGTHVCCCSAVEGTNGELNARLLRWPLAERALQRRASPPHPLTQPPTNHPPLPPPPPTQQTPPPWISSKSFSSTKS